MNIQMKVRSLEKVRLFIKRGQIRSMTILLVYALRLDLYLHLFLKMADKIIHLWTFSGRKATVGYLKECVRATVQFLAGQVYQRSPTAVHIRLDKSGLPVIIPGPLRNSIRSIKLGEPTTEPLMIARCILSILSLWRTIRVRGTVADLSSVTSPYTGTVFSLLKEVKVVSRWFPKLVVRKGGSWRISETSGPNSPLSTWGAFADVFAFVYDSRVYHRVLLYARKREATVHLVWLMSLKFLVETVYFSGTLFALWSLTLHPVLSLLLGTFYTWQFYKLFGFEKVKWCTGRLATFDEGGGKVRIVAIFDAWSQWLLKPLHDGIFDLFAKLETDGTHNQVAPLVQLMDYIRVSGSPAYSFDLTAATDRLPIWLQVEVLSAFKFNASTEWRELISNRSFRVTPGYKDSISKAITEQIANPELAQYCEEVEYSVGQPMGAYSSWAVMALTHHVIVQIAALRVGHSGFFRHYALLGDDIVIANEEVAMKYLEIMKEIGVGVNRLKSIESNMGFAEFAKRWVHPHLGEISPIGARLLLSVIKNQTLLPSLFSELAQKGVALYPSNIDAVLLGLCKIRGRKLPSREFLRDLEVAALAPNGILNHGHMITEWLSVWIRKISNSTLDEFIHRNMLIKPFWDEQIKTVEARPWINLRYFFKAFWRTPMVKGRIAAWLLQPMVVLTPGFWLYLQAIIKACQTPPSFSLQMYGLTRPDDREARQHISLSMLPEHANNRSIDWRERGAVAKHTIALKAYGEALRRVTIPEHLSNRLRYLDPGEPAYRKRGASIYVGGTNLHVDSKPLLLLTDGVQRPNLQNPPSEPR